MAALLLLVRWYCFRRLVRWFCRWLRFLVL